MKKYFFPALFLLSITFLPALAAAQPLPGSGSSGSLPGSGASGASQGTQYQIPTNGKAFSVPNPLGADSFCGLIKNLLQAAIAIGIPIAVLFIVFAGFKFVMAQGKPEELKKARQNFLYTLIGIGIFLGAWLLADVIANTVNQLGGQQNIISCH